MKTQCFVVGLVCLLSFVVSASSVAQAQSSARSQVGRLSITPANSNDSSPPTILIAEPQKLRGIALRRKSTSLSIRGRVIDDNKVARVTLNDHQIDLDVHGWFEEEDYEPLDSWAGY